MVPTIERINARQRSHILRERMQGLARQIGAGGKFPKVTELCRDFRVSPTTLNAVLSDLERDGVIVRRHAIGIFVADALPTTVHRALVCHPAFFRAPQLSPFWSMLMDGIRARSAQRGEVFDLYLSNPTTPDEPLPSGVMDDIRSGRITGVLGVGLHDDAWWIMQQRVPLVTLFGKGHVIVGANRPRQMQMAVCALRDRGCEKLAFWARAWPFHEEHELRLEVEAEVQMWRDTLSELGLSARAARIYSSRDVADGDERRAMSLQEQGFRAAMQTLGSDGARPDGIYINDDNMTQGALVAMHRLGIRVGHDVALATLANTGSKTLWGHEDDMILLQYDPAHFIDALFNSLDDLLSGRRPLQEDQMELVEPQLREPLES